MKVWIKYLIAAAFAFALNAVLPQESPLVAAACETMCEIALRVGRYSLIPLVFFSAVMAVFSLRKDRMLLKTALMAVVVSVALTAILTLFACLVLKIVGLPHLPISNEGGAAPVAIDIKGSVTDVFPYSAFDVFHDGGYLLPLLVFAGFVGAALAVDETLTKQAARLFDSLAKAFYYVSSFFVDVFSIFLTFSAFRFLRNFGAVASQAAYLRLFATLFFCAAAVIALVYPLLLFAIFREKRPFRLLYASLAGIVAAFFTADANIALLVNLHHEKESLGAQDRVNFICMPVFSIFSRAGSAFVALTAFIVIIRSYTTLALSADEFFSAALFVLVHSFFIGRLPSGGMFALLTAACAKHGGGFEQAYLIALPMLFCLSSVAAMLDGATTLFATHVVARWQKATERKSLRMFL